MFPNGSYGHFSKDSSMSSSRNNFDMEENHFKVAKRFMREHGEPPPRPPHLKGRAIGMWYSKMGKLKRSLDNESPGKKIIRPVASVKLTNSQEQGIRAVLNSLPDKKDHSSSIPTNAYENIEDSQFKTEFLQNINGRLEDHIDDLEMTNQQDSSLDDMLYRELQLKNEDQMYSNILRQRNQLPSFGAKEKIVDLINLNQVTLISGETGCGKTTQVPQFILDYFIGMNRGSLCNIICTQPRRISAISVAERVAQERAERLGQSIGYQIRLEKVCPRRRGSITFCTTGVVLRQMQTDPCLSECSHIIIDEIHERDIQTDFLITLLKQVIAKRADLKIILMSATLNAESFSRYFDNCPHLNIPGFTYLVQEYFLEDVLERTRFHFEDEKLKSKNKSITQKHRSFNSLIEPYVKQLQRQQKYNRNVYNELRNPSSEILNLELVFALLLDICYNEKEDGAVLIFVPGFSDISDLCKIIKNSRQLPPERFLIISLHSQIPMIQQKTVFETPPPGVRKIIISTNIAETSITIDDVVFVIDCGRIKINFYDKETNTSTLEANWVSKANANQRKGRAGRVKPGVCFHLVSRARYQTLENYMLPEILRVRLENVILTAKLLQLGKVEDFFSRLMDSPDPGIVSTSLDLLKRLEALDGNEHLTPLGYHLAKLPMNPQIGKMLLFGALFNCLEPILDIAVTLDYRDPFLIPLGKEKDADRKKKEFAGTCQSDHILMAKMIDTFENLNHFQQKQFCWKHFVSFSTMCQLVQLKRDFMQNLFDLKFVPNRNPKNEECNSNSDRIDLIRAVICAGLYPNVVKVRTRGRKRLFNLLSLPNGTKVHFHPKSILNNEHISNPLLVYYKIVKSSKMYIHEATPVDPFHIIFFGDNFRQIKDEKGHYISINESLKFKCQHNTSNIIKTLRDKLNNFLEYQISHPNVVDLRNSNEENVLFRTIIELLTNNDMAECEWNSPEDQDLSI